jgi:hypothetical protein
MFMDHEQAAIRNHNIKNKTTVKMAKFKYVGLTQTNQNCVCEEIKSR